MSNTNEVTAEELAERYKKEFDPFSYLEMYYPSKSLHAFAANMLGMLHRIFAFDIVDAESMLDLGSGPTVFSAISASINIKKIVISDFVDKNVQEVKKWINRDPTAHNWDTYFEQVAKLEHEPNPSKLEKRVRNSIKDAIHCNALLPNPIAPHTDHFDVVFTGYVYEAVSTSEEQFHKAIANSVSLLNDGGYLIYTGAFQIVSCYVGDSSFPLFPLNKDTVNKALVAANMKPLLWTVFPKLEDDPMAGEFDSLFLVLAKKI